MTMDEFVRYRGGVSWILKIGWTGMLLAVVDIAHMFGAVETAMCLKYRKYHLGMEERS